MNWPEEKSFLLIELYKSYPILWNTKDPHYFKKIARIDAWNTISSTLGESEETCRSKLLSMLSSYRREKIKERRKKATGKGAGGGYKSRWFAYQALRFLDSRNKPFSAEFTEQTSSVDDEEVSDDDEECSLEATEINDFLTNPNNSYSDPPSNSSTLSLPESKKRKADEPNAVMMDALKILKNTTMKMDEKLVDDEIKSFGNFITSKMVKYSPATRTGVQHAIFEVLMKADLGYYEPTPASMVKTEFQ